MRKKLPANVVSQPEIFTLVAVIREGKKVSKFTNPRVLRFRQIYTSIGMDVRYMILEHPPNFWLVDVLDVMFIPDYQSKYGRQFYVGEYIELPTLDAAIAAGVLI